MAISLTSLMTSLKSAFQNNSGSIRNTSIGLLVFGLNMVVESEDFFQCPPDNFVFYAGCFHNCSCFVLISADFGTLFVDAASLQGRKGEEQKRFCCCFYPRWSCSKPLVEILFQSSLSGLLWIFWVLLQRDYYVCAVLGGTKEAKLINATAEEKLQIEADYANAGQNSQTAALLLLGGAFITALVAISVQRCCFQQEIGSLPDTQDQQTTENNHM
ncbi:cation channel [Desmophyllum pertusum]|uniref:Cation channel n=1 Tax=Desmophyllum pertusum TaxID=174260 RepID=A0A9X0CEI0_9CNID|nr:cation channel [Desmophyllum pertusum]